MSLHCDDVWMVDGRNVQLSSTGFETDKRIEADESVQSVGPFINFEKTITIA